jgi:uncharacterized membrane protein
MLYLLEASGPFVFWIDLAARGVEILAVAIIVFGIIFATGRYFYLRLSHSQEEHLFKRYKQHIGSTLLLGLELLIAADIVKTVAVEATIENISILGLLVVIRTFLSWSLVVDIEERWPWQPSRAKE